MAYWSRDCLYFDLLGNPSFRYDSRWYILADQYHVSSIIRRNYGFHFERTHASY